MANTVGSEQVIDYSRIQSEDGYTFRPVIDKTIIWDSYNKRLGNHFSMNTVGDYELNKVLDGKRLLVFEKTAVE